MRNIINVVSWMGINSPWGGSVASNNVEGLQPAFFEIANSLYVIGTMLAIIMLIYGAIVYITSAGDDNKVKQGGTIITNALLGLIVLFLLKAIFGLVVSGITNL